MSKIVTAVLAGGILLGAVAGGTGAAVADRATDTVRPVATADRDWAATFEPRVWEDGSWRLGGFTGCLPGGLCQD